jgi:ATP-dependent Lon protease
MLCKDNEKDIRQIPEIYVKGLTFHFVENIEDVLAFALLDEKVDKPQTFTIPEENCK